MKKQQRETVRERLEQQLADLQEQLDALDLLWQIYSELGPYTTAISTKLRRDLNNFFDHDDSE